MLLLSKPLKHLVIAGVVAFGLTAGLVQAETTINGAGATFPYPIYAKWAEAYKAKTGVSMNYQSIGSGGGIKQITARTVDFGASDAHCRKTQRDRPDTVPHGHGRRRSGDQYRRHQDG